VNDCYVSLDEQRRFQSQPGLPEHHLHALEDARGILTCISSDAEATNFRKELIARGTNADTRLGHMPGASLDDLAHAAIDHLQAERYCEELALAMALGWEAKLKSYTRDNKGNITGENELFLDLHGLDRAPITSTGVIPLGTWGNIPGAETFIAPWEDSAEGTFVLNGSFPGRVIPPGRYLLLTFRAGYLIDIKGDDELARSFSHFFETAKPAVSVCHKAVAELGIGVNPAIERLTGNLADEKYARTAHIAVGDSRRYGGRNESSIHEDLVTLGPSLSIDGKEILRYGEYVLQSRDWNEPLSEVVMQPPFSYDDFLVSRTALSVEAGPPLKVRREVAQGRIGLYAIGESEDNKLLSCIYEATP
jgi:hypothetical protein